MRAAADMSGIGPNGLRRRTIVVTGVFGIFIAATVVGALYFGQRQPIPADIRAQVEFTVFLPTSGVTINAESYKFDSNQKVFSFTGRLATGQVITIAEQSTPDPFNDIPNYSKQFFLTLSEYQAFDSLQGMVHLTHPKDAGQAAVMNAKGTLLFARVAHDENKATWQRIFNSLTLYQPL